MEIETIGNVEFEVPDLPEEWRGWSFAAKRAWLINHARPRPSFGEAQRILSQHAAAARKARKARQEKRERARRARG